MKRTDVQDRVVSMPRPLGEPGVLAALLRALPHCLAPSDEVSVVTPYGARFTDAVRQHCRRSGSGGFRYDLRVGDPALEVLARAAAGAERTGVVYLYVSRGTQDLLAAEQTYDWLRLGPALSAGEEACLLARLAVTVGPPGPPAA